MQRKQLQGYEIVFEKRQRGGTYIEQHGLVYNHNYKDGTYIIRDIPDGKKTYTISSNPLSFGKTLFFNADILENKVIELVAPATIKLKVTGHGRGSKDNVRKSIINLDLFKDIKFKNNDESDSAAVGYTYIMKLLDEK